MARPARRRGGGDPVRPARRGLRDRGEGLEASDPGGARGGLRSARPPRRVPVRLDRPAHDRSIGRARAAEPARGPCVRPTASIVRSRRSLRRRVRRGRRALRPNGRRARGGTTRVVARHKADRDIPLVGAASVVAKVRRDRAIGRLAERLGEEIGSGYPSDERTVAFVRRTVRAGAPPPIWMRASWATTKRVILPRPALTLDGFRV